MSSIQCVIYDFDGVMTDNCVIVDEFGSESVKCNRSDGLAIQKIKAQGILQMILSTEENKVVLRRAKKLKIPAIHGSKDKREALQKIVKDYKISLDNILFIGNDLNDLEAMQIAGHRACPSDAADEIKELEGIIITNKKGGEGVIREIYSKIFQKI